MIEAIESVQLRRIAVVLVTLHALNGSNETVYEFLDVFVNEVCPTKRNALIENIKDALANVAIVSSAVAAGKHLTKISPNIQKYFNCVDESLANRFEAEIKPLMTFTKPIHNVFSSAMLSRTIKLPTETRIIDFAADSWTSAVVLRECLLSGLTSFVQLENMAWRLWSEAYPLMHGGKCDMQNNIAWDSTLSVFFRGGDLGVRIIQDDVSLPPNDAIKWIWRDALSNIKTFDAEFSSAPFYPQWPPSKENWFSGFYAGAHVISSFKQGADAPLMSISPNLQFFISDNGLYACVRRMRRAQKFLWEIGIFDAQQTLEEQVNLNTQVFGKLFDAEWKISGCSLICDLASLLYKRAYSQHLQRRIASLLMKRRQKIKQHLQTECFQLLGDTVARDGVLRANDEAQSLDSSFNDISAGMPLAHDSSIRLDVIKNMLSGKRAPCYIVRDIVLTSCSESDIGSVLALAAWKTESQISDWLDAYLRRTTHGSCLLYTYPTFVTGIWIPKVMRQNGKLHTYGGGLPWAIPSWLVSLKGGSLTSDPVGPRRGGVNDLIRFITTEASANLNDRRNQLTHNVYQWAQKIKMSRQRESDNAEYWADICNDILNEVHQEITKRTPELQPPAGVNALCKKLQTDKFKAWLTNNYNILQQLTATAVGLFA